MISKKYSITFTLTGLPATINKIGRQHWGIKVKEANYWKQCVLCEVANKKPPKPLKKARVVFTRFSSHRPDSDNLLNSFKHVQDGLVTSRIIENDTYENIGFPECKWEKAKSGEGRIKVEVYAI